MTRLSTAVKLMHTVMSDMTKYELINPFCCSLRPHRLSNYLLESRQPAVKLAAWEEHGEDGLCPCKITEGGIVKA